MRERERERERIPLLFVHKCSLRDKFLDKIRVEETHSLDPKLSKRYRECAKGEQEPCNVWTFVVAPKQPFKVFFSRKKRLFSSRCVPFYFFFYLFLGFVTTGSCPTAISHNGLVPPPHTEMLKIDKYVGDIMEIHVGKGNHSFQICSKGATFSETTQKIFPFSWDIFCRGRVIRLGPFHGAE